MTNNYKQQKEAKAMQTVDAQGGTMEKYQNYFFFIPVVSSLCALIAIFMWGLHPGIDLKGGSLLQVHYVTDRPQLELVQAKVNTLNYGEVRIQPSNDKDFILRQRDLLPAEKSELSGALASFGALEEVQFNSVGPSIGAELMQTSLLQNVLKKN